jgi:hypothetical protein
MLIDGLLMVCLSLDCRKMSTWSCVSVWVSTLLRAVWILTFRHHVIQFTGWGSRLSFQVVAGGRASRCNDKNAMNAYGAHMEHICSTCAAHIHASEWTMSNAKNYSRQIK